MAARLHDTPDSSLVLEDEPVTVTRPEGRSSILLLCEHASKRIPETLGDLGMDEAAQESHAAWDIGALKVAQQLSALLDAPLIHQNFSRLVYDCNRPPESPTAIPPKSEIYEIPGNVNLSAADKAARAEAIYFPFRDAITTFLDDRRNRGFETQVVTIHSFTPFFFGKARVGDLGVLHGDDSRLADVLLQACDAEDGLHARRNYPYDATDGVLHSLNLHGGGRGLPNVMLEIRNDLISAEAGQAFWAERLARLLDQATAALNTN